MKPISCLRFALFAPLAVAGACARPLPAITSHQAAERPPFRFAQDDERLLDDIQHGCFNFFWNACDPVTGMVYDRTSKPVISVAGVGFQLSAIPIGVERGWITRDQGNERATRILRALLDQPDNRKFGHFYHYLEPGTAAPSHAGYERIVSTIDSAILMAGAITAGEYFGGDARDLAERMFTQADWKAMVPPDRDVKNPSERGCISLGWKPADPDLPTGPGSLLPYYWVDSGDEHRLVNFLAVCAPMERHRLPPEMYYRLRRALGSDEGNEPFVWFPWSGALFTAFFAHAWIDYAHLHEDNPADFNQHCRPPVDWWENSRRIVAMHRRKAVQNPKGLPTLGENAWGLSACDNRDGYLVPGLLPKRIEMPGCTPEFDFSAVQPEDNYGDGTIAPYAAGSAIIFEPHASLAALHHYRTIDLPPLWNDPASGGFGFQDAFNAGTRWVAPDCVAIDQGPLILLIENARTGKVWKWFSNSQNVKAGKERLRLR
ncbi:MAG: hypothetical protein JNK58_02525 [Phycisphaerae bacterium]|nr:hypothetical protein [Phycisphaerae bacterium]